MSGKKEKQMKGDITEITYEFREKPVPKKWHKFIYDSSEGTFFDRTAKSWGEYMGWIAKNERFASGGACWGTSSCLVVSGDLDWTKEIDLMV